MMKVVNDDLILNESESIEFINKIKNPNKESIKKMNDFLSKELFEIINTPDGRVFMESPDFDFNSIILENNLGKKKEIKFNPTCNNYSNINQKTKTALYSDIPYRKKIGDVNDKHERELKIYKVNIKIAA